MHSTDTNHDDKPRFHTWQPIEEFSRGFWPVVDPTLEATAEKEGFPAELCNFAQLGLEYWSRASFEEQDALTKFDAIETWFEELAGDGWLESVGGGRYRVTQATRDGVRTLIQAGDTYLGTLDIMPLDDLTRLASYMQRVVRSSIATPAPPSQRITLHRFRAIDETTPILGQIRDYGMDLYAYRDDSHRSAWQTFHPIEGYVWNTLSYIWHGEHSTAEQIAEQVAFRNYTADDYGRALERLVRFGWIETDGEQFQITDIGKQVREGVETRTDAYFYRPWRELSAIEWREMHNLCVQLAAALEEMGGS